MDDVSEDTAAAGSTVYKVVGMVAKDLSYASLMAPRDDRPTRTWNDSVPPKWNTMLSPGPYGYGGSGPADDALGADRVA